MFSVVMLLIASLQTFLRRFRIRVALPSFWPSGRRVTFGALLGVCLVSMERFMALAQTSGAQATGGDSGSIFGYEVTESRIAYTGLAALICPVLVSLIAKLDTKGWQKTALNIGLAMIFAALSWFVDKFGTSEYVIQALSIFVVASGIYFANQSGFRSLTADAGRT